MSCSFWIQISAIHRIFQKKNNLTHRWLFPARGEWREDSQHPFQLLKTWKTPLTLQQSCTATNDIPLTCEKVLPKSYHSEPSSSHELSGSCALKTSKNDLLSAVIWCLLKAKDPLPVSQATERQGNQFSMHQEESKSSVHLPNTNKYSEDWKEAQNLFKAKMVLLNS